MAGNNNETTTRFRVDISELKSAMQDARRLVANANSEFNAVASSMDDWRKSSEGLTAKLNQLRSNLESQESILREYEHVLEEVRREYGENSNEAIEYQTRLNNQQAVVNRIRREMAEYEETLREVSEAEAIASRTGQDVADVLNDVGEEAEDAEGGFTVLKGAVAEFVGNALTNLVDGLKDAISSLITFGDEADRAMNNLTAKTGLYTDGMEKFEDVMKNIYNANYGESFEDISDAMAEVMTQSWDWGAENIEKVTTNALTLRDTFDFEVAESVRAVNMMMEQFGITSDEAFNLIARGTQVGLNKNGDLLDVINEYSVHYSQMGASAEEFFYSLNNGASQGVFSVDKLGDAYKEFGIRTKDTASSTTEAYELLGLNADKMRSKFAEGGDSAKEASAEVMEALFSIDDQVKQNQAGVGLFGTMWEDLGKDAIESLMQISEDGSDSFIDLYETMDDINAIKYDSFGEALQGIGRNLQTGILMPISEKLLPIVSDLAAKFSEWLNDPATQEGIKNFTDSVAEFVDNGLAAIKDGVQFYLDNKDDIISSLAAIAAGLTALGTAYFIQNFSSIVSNLKKWITSTKLAAAAQGLWNAVMNANPMVLLTTVIATVVAAIVAFIATNDEARAKVVEIWNNVTQAISEFVSNAITYFKELPGKIRECIATVITNIIRWKDDMIAKAKETGINFVNNIIEFFTTLPGKISECITNVIANIIQWKDSMIAKAKELGSQFLQNIIEFFSTLPYNVGYFIGSTLRTVALWTLDMIAKAKETGINFINKIIEFFKTLPEKISEWITNAIAKVTEWKDDMITKAKEVGSQFLEKITEFFSTLPGKIHEWITNVITKITKWKDDMIAKAKETGKKFIDEVIAKVKELPDKVNEWLTNTIDKLKTWITDMGEKGKEAIGELIENVTEGAKEIPDKMMEIGSNIVDGVWNGIKKAKDQFFANVKGFFSGLVDGAKGELKIESPSKVFANEVGKWIPEGIAVGIADNAKSVLGAMKDLTVNALGSAKAGLNTEAITGGGAVVGGGVVNNFTQVINSPKQLSRLDIYRQSKNLLGYAGGGL